MEQLITLRNCNLKDAEVLVSLGIRTFRDTFDEFNSPENMMNYINSAFTVKKLKEELLEPGSMFFLAEMDDEAVGYARVKASTKPEGLSGISALEIQRLYVDKRFLGKRVGHLLMNECLHYAKEHGYDVTWLGVWEHNARAIAFYQKWGFEKFGQHIFKLGDDPQTDFLFQKKIL